MLVLKVKPFSINAMYYNSRVKTTEAREWSGHVFNQLSWSKNQVILAKIRDEFDPHKHSIEVELIAYYPQEIYFTKDGKISGKTIDCSNWEKPLIDLIFLPKYYGQIVPNGCDNLNIDDKFISKICSEKLPADLDDHVITVQIKLVEKSKVRTCSF